MGTVDPQRAFTFDDGFADEEFTPDPDLPVSHNTFTFADHDGGTRVTYASRFDTAEELQQALDMGAEEGATLAINQIDDVLAA
ncbi:SRPBCC family protein [Mariniluteicoccus flavus]